MTITVVCDVLGEENNGTIMASMNLIRYLSSKGHKVQVLCANKPSSTGGGLCNFFVVPNKSFGKQLDKIVEKVGVSLAKPDPEIVEKAVVGADIVHLMVPFALSNKALEVALKNNIPVTAGFHMQAENFTSYLKLNKSRLANHLVYQYIWNNTYKYVDGIHYPTRFIREIFERHIKKDTPGYVISNGVNSYVQKQEVEKPNEYKDKIVILSIGRLAREKSQDTLIKAMKYSKYSNQIQLIFAGQGLKENKYKKLAKKLPIAPIFQRFPREDIVKMLNYSDLYVHPAEIELEGIACLEAICCGKLTIVSDSRLSATREFAIDDKCIFKNRNPKDLARVIDYWIEHPEEKKEYEQKYLASSVVFSQDACMKQMEDMMFEVITLHKQKEK